MGWSRAQRFVVASGWLTALALALTGCAALLIWDVEGHPCNADDECYEGYVCLVDTCIPVHSLPAGQVCTDDLQCEATAICATDFDGYCRTVCDDYFSISGCETGEYCRPLFVEGESCEDLNDCDEGDACREAPGGGRRCHSYTGICVGSDDCDPDAPWSGCGSQVCLDIGGPITGCFDGCEIDWIDGVYSDNCGSAPYARRYCTVLIDRLVCMPTDYSGEVYDPCDPVYPNPCRPGLGCVGEYCRRHCDHAGDGDAYCSRLEFAAEGKPVCQTVQLSSGPIGVCVED